MFADTHVVKLFPVPVWVHGLEPQEAEKIDAGLRKAIDRAWGQTGPAGGGAAWQTPASLQDQAEASDLVAAIQTAAKGVLDHLTVTQEAFLIGGMQAEIAPSGAANPVRSRSDAAYLSGIYALQSDGGAGIMFDDPKPQGVERARYGQATEYNSRHANLTLQTGTLILFPAWLNLTAPANSGAQDRITIGFDITLVE